MADYDSLLSDDPHAIGGYLAKLYQEILPEDPQLRSAVRTFEQEVYLPSPVSRADADTVQQKRQAAFNGIIDELKLIPDESEKAAKAFALQSDVLRVEHLYSLADLVARENYLVPLEERGLTNAKLNRSAEELNFAPGGVADFAFRNESVADAQARLNAVHFEITMTAHPTSVEAAAFIAQTRQVALAATALRDAVRGGQTSEEDLTKLEDVLKGHLQSFQQTAVIPMKDGKPVTLGVNEEAALVVQYLTNSYEDVPRLYKSFDTALDTRAAYGNEQYDPLSLHLSLQFNDWGGGGDNDGNKKVRSEYTLEAAVMHRRAITGLYLRDVEALNTPELAKWQQMLAEKQAALTVLSNAIGELRGRMNTPGATLADYLETPSWQALEASIGKNGVSQELIDGLRALIAEKGTGKTEGFFLTSEVFDGLSAAFGETTFDWKGLDEAVQGVYRTSPSQEALDLSRRIRTYEDVLAPIEYRQTAEVYEKVISRILIDIKEQEDGRDVMAEALGADISKVQDILKKHSLGELTYEAMATRIDGQGYPLPESDIEALTGYRIRVMEEMLKDRDTAASLLNDGIYAKIVQEGAGKAYDDDNAYPHAYQTLKRIELAADHPEMIRKHVLAECQNAANALELQFLLEAVARPGKREHAHLDIIPLTEDPDAYARSPKMFAEMLTSPAHLRHLHEIKDFRDYPAITIERQNAHSDTGRRAGQIGSKGAIYGAFKEQNRVIAAISAALMASGEIQEPIVVHDFQGKSDLDMLRAGGRENTAMINTFGMHSFAKFTYQGKDNAVYFNIPQAFERMMVRTFVNCADRVPMPSEVGPIKPASIAGGASYSVRLDNADARDIIDDVVIAAARRTIPDYQADFTTDHIGSLLTALRYEEETEINNVSSRAPTRFSGPVTVQQGAEMTVKDFKEKRKVDVQKIRTISGTQTLIQAGAILGGMGGLKVEQYLAEEVRSFLGEKPLTGQTFGYDQTYDPVTLAQGVVKQYVPEWQAKLPMIDDRDTLESALSPELTRRLGCHTQESVNTARTILREQFNLSLAQQTPETGRFMARNSNTYRAIMDHTVFAGALADLELVEKMYSDVTQVDYWKAAKREHAVVVDLAMRAMPGLRNVPDIQDHPPNEQPFDTLRRNAVAALPHASDSLNEDRRGMEYGVMLKNWMLERWQAVQKGSDVASAWLAGLRTTSAGIAQAVLVPIPQISDPAYGLTRYAMEQKDKGVEGHHAQHHAGVHEHAK